jgi:taurine dioxygenase
MTLTIDIEPASAAAGARIHGIDLHEEIDDRTIDMIRNAFTEYSVLCFPGQKISPDDQLRFANLFGRGDGSFRDRSSGDLKRSGSRGVMLVSNIRKNGQPIGSLPDGEMQFHTDGAHREYPYRATTLYAIRIPSHGGNTLFADLYKAYDTLSDAMKARIEDLKTVCVYDYAATERSTIGDDPDLPRATHRLVKTHPDSGRKSLYVCRLMTEYIVGMSRDESEKLLVGLIDHAENPEFVYAHEWTPGDLLIWDNRCLNHARTDFPAEEQRLLRRYTVSEPNAPVAN